MCQNPPTNLSFPPSLHPSLQVTMADSMSILLWGLIRYEDAYSAARKLEHT